VRKLAKDRATQIEKETVWEEIGKRLRSDRSRGEFAAVHAVPQSSADVPDEKEARLVILDPQKPHSGKTSESDALLSSKEILEKRGNIPRLYRNMLAFLAADKARSGDLEQAVRQYRAWKSICEERETLNLDAFQSNRAKTELEQADETVKHRIGEAYVWLIAPSQSDPEKPIEWNETRLQGQEPLAVRASKKLINEEGLIVKYSAARLRIDLDKYLWKDVSHINIKKLWDFFATYPYLSRLKDSQVLLTTIQEGVSNFDLESNFAYAESWDEKKHTYLNLKARESCSLIMDNKTLLVKPEQVQKQLDEEKGSFQEGGDAVRPPEAEPEAFEKEPAVRKLRRFHRSATLDVTRIGRDAGKIAEEIIQHLSTLTDAELHIILDIQAQVPDGIPENVIRIITENCNTLHFDQYGFEED
jgi:hypothetical protein